MPNERDMLDRLLKAGMLRLAYLSQSDDPLSWPITCVDSYGMSVDSSAEAVRVLHGYPEIPWPYRGGVVVSRSRVDYVNVVYPISSDDDWSRFFHLGVGVVRGEIQFDGPHGMFMVRRLLDSEATLTDRTVETVRQTILEEAQTAVGAPEDKELILQSIPDSGSVWMLGKTASGRRGSTHTTLECRHLSAALYLSSLAALVTPCGYAVHMKIEGGYGTKKQRRTTGATVITLHIGHDRLYRIREGVRRTGEFTLRHREEHTRHMWSRVGIDYRKLPKTSAERLRLACMTRCPTVQVKEHWMGPRDFVRDGIRYTIPDGPIDVTMLPARLVARNIRREAS